MKKKIKLSIFAGICLVVGVVLFLIGLSIVDFRFNDIENESYSIKTKNVEGEFTSINVTEISQDVRIEPSSDQTVKVRSCDSDIDYVNVEVKDGVLNVKRTDERKWYHFIGINISEDDLTKTIIYLPEGEYESLIVTTTSGDVLVNDQYTFKNVTATVTSAEVYIYAKILSEVSVSSTSGDVSLKNVECANVTLNLISGDVGIVNGKVKNLKVKTTSGDIDIDSVIATGKVEIETTSGDVDLIGIDGAEIDIRTTSGDVEGIFKTPKNFNARSTSGRVYVPQPDSTKGPCKIITTSGDISVRIG